MKHSRSSVWAARRVALIAGLAYLLVGPAAFSQLEPNNPGSGSGGGGSATPGGGNKQVQYNSAGAFAGNRNFTYDSVTHYVRIDTGGITCPDVTGGATTERFGNGSAAQGANSVAIGNAAAGNSPSSVAVGSSAVTGTGGTGGVVVVGATSSGGVWSTVVGFNSTATSGAGFPRQTLIGKGIRSNGADAVAVGGDITANAANTVTVGSGNTNSGTNGTVVGEGAGNTQSHSTALGAGATTTAAGQVRLGTSADSVSIPGGLYVAGNTSTSGTLTATGAITGASTVSNLYGQVQPYRVYVALVADSGVVAVLQNTLGGAVTFGGGGGTYTFTKTGAFTASKTVCFFGNATSNIQNGPQTGDFHRTSANDCTLNTWAVDFVGQNWTSASLDNTTPAVVEIRVYP